MSLARKYHIVQTSSPWVSEDEVSPNHFDRFSKGFAGTQLN